MTMTHDLEVCDPLTVRELPNLWAAPLDGKSVAKTQGEIEAAIGTSVTRFEQCYMGRGPKQVHTYLIDDFLVCRLQCVLTAAEQQLVKSLSSERGKDLVKRVRTQLIQTARPVLEALVEEITGVKVVSLHYDISTVTGEEVVLFTLAKRPFFRGSATRH